MIIVKFYCCKPFQKYIYNIRIMLCSFLFESKTKLFIFHAAHRIVQKNNIKSLGSCDEKEDIILLLKKNLELKKRRQK